jgi:hypothetical protein
VNVTRNRRASIARALGDEQSFATTLLVIVADEYGLEAFSGSEAWHPTTLRMEVLESFGVEMPPINGDKLAAAIDIVTSDNFFRRLTVFNTYCNVLSGTPPDFTSFDPADIYEVAWGLTEALLLSPAEEDEEPFADEIRHYIGRLVSDAGLLEPPDILRLGIIEPRYDTMPDDPDGFADAFKMQAEDSEEVTVWLRERVTLLADQLGSLVLDNGSTDELVRRIRGYLQQQ